MQPVVSSLKNKRSSSNLTSEERTALKSLREDDTIAILPSDKGRCTVVMNRSQYDEKVMSLLNDQDTYSPIPSNPSMKMERKIIKTLSSLRESHAITDDEYKRMRPSDSILPLFYGLPKIHKDGIPLRPIVSFCGSPTYKIAKELSRRLKPLTLKSTIMVRNSEDFINRLSNIEINNDEMMVSFDVKSLFTCIPLNVAKRAVRNAIDNDEDFFFSEQWSRDEFLTLLDLCLSSTYFGFRGKVYHQKKGTPMGSPVSVVLAELVLQEFEKSFFLQPIQEVKLWLRYVDDTFSIIKKEFLETLNNLLNQKGDFLQFTRECEENDHLPFLDVDISRVNSRLITGVFRKNTYTDRLLDFNSDHPLCHKKSVVRTLWKRAERNCNSPISLQKEKEILFRIFKKNGYPRNRIRNWTNDLTPSEDTSTLKNYVSIPYIKGVSEITARILKEGGVYAAHKPMNTLRMQLTSVKDKRPKDETIGTVYSIPCSDCTLSYVGQSKRKLGTRLEEHRKAIEKHDRLSNMAMHELETNHKMNLEETSILYTNNNWQHRLFLEAWATNDSTLNRSIDIDPSYLALK